MKQGKYKILAIVCGVAIVIAIIVIFYIQSNKSEVKGDKQDNATASINDEKEKYSCKNPVVPDGFHKLETDAASWELDEEGNVKGWNDGLVVQDDIGNEFVWIPVENILELERKEGYFGGEEQKFLTKISEPDYINQTDESKLVYESMIKYHGFYIARYEAGESQYTADTPLDDRFIPVSMPNRKVFASIPWGSAYGYATDGIQGSDTSGNVVGAVRMARSMYPDTENMYKYNLLGNGENSTGVVSTLCYGIQWDAIMNFISDIDNPYTGTKYIEDSTSMGWFAFNSHNAIHLSGMPVDDKNSNCVKNIYDLAGNASEWTMEIYDGKYRVERGGSCIMANIFPSASMRANGNPDYGNGLRVALYIK